MENIRMLCSAEGENSNNFQGTTAQPVHVGDWMESLVSGKSYKVKKITHIWIDKYSEPFIKVELG